MRGRDFKARLCTQGNRSMAAFAMAYGIRYVRCRKLVVAVTADEVPHLEALTDRARANGVVARRQLWAEKVPKTT